MENYTNQQLASTHFSTLFLSLFSSKEFFTVSSSSKMFTRAENTVHKTIIVHREYNNNNNNNNNSNNKSNNKSMANQNCIQFFIL